MTVSTLFSLHGFYILIYGFNIMRRPTGPSLRCIGRDAPGYKYVAPPEQHLESRVPNHSKLANRKDHAPSTRGDSPTP